MVNRKNYFDKCTSLHKLFISSTSENYVHLKKKKMKTNTYLYLLHFWLNSLQELVEYSVIH